MGKYIYNEKNDVCIKITETEAYTGPEDKACHAYGFRKTKRNSILYSDGGYAYVYLIYGMYYCFNVSTDYEGYPSAVLVRGGEACEESLDKVSDLRFGKGYKDLSAYQKKNLLNGPGKFCLGMGITKNDNGLDFCKDNIYFFDDKKDTSYDIKCGKRINIDYAEEYRDMLWRFYI